ncbi:MAG: transporter [Burkholderiaceae bacterium]
MKEAHMRAQSLCVLAVALFSAPVFAGRPLTIDDAVPVERGAYEFEAGLEFSNAPGERHRDLPLGLAYGIAPRLEIGAGWGFHLRDRIEGNSGTVSGLQDFSLGFKWMPVSTETGFMLALAGGVTFGTASRSKGLGSGDEDFDLTAIATQQWERLGLDVNVGHTWVGKKYDSSLADNIHYGAALRYALTETWTVVGEVFADDLKGSRAEWQFNTGVQYAVRKNVVLDAALAAD